MGGIVTREELPDSLDLREVGAYSRNIDMIISHLRRSVRLARSEKLPILSVHGIGHVFTGLGKLLGDSPVQSSNSR